ncbi:sulfur carrier protein ThiS [Photobacterium damselae]|uniref:sulfur carrier protein ThiS n=1 Tax=Photobacterium damselae TaxID=38293 RepID=UPI0015A2CDA8|nr:sulfur carrier protein ThiS [Photobacterium damselae]NVO60566.1 sulfur carrier protein ThiS [Photobacterium damselae subsp. damselae]
MKLWFNGEVIEMVDTVSLEQLITYYQLVPHTIAVALNQQIIPRSVWSQQPLNDGDHIDVFQAIAGG